MKEVLGMINLSLKRLRGGRYGGGGVSSLGTLFRKCGTEEETSVHILCECEVSASSDIHILVPFFLNPEDIMKLIIGVI
jgi:hypothetical protein